MQKVIQKVVFGFFLVLLFSLAFMKPTLDVGRISLTPTDIVFPIFFSCWMIGLATRSFRIEWANAYWALAFYLVAALISTLFSVSPTVSGAKLAGVFYLVTMAVAATSVVSSVDRLKFSVVTWSAVAVLPILIALVALVLFIFARDSWVLQHITYHQGASPIGQLPRINSTFVTPSMFCNYLTVTLMLVLMSWRLDWLRSSIVAVLTIFIVVAAMLTFSISLGGVFLVLGIWVWMTGSSGTSRRLTLSLAISLAIVFLAIAPIELSDESLRGELRPSSRLLVWSDTMKSISSDPLTGRGLGTGAANVEYRNLDGTSSVLTDAHNSFLNVTAESGLIGLAAILVLVIAVLRSAFSDLKSRDHRLIRIALGIAFVAAFVYEGLTGSFEDARHLWILMGFVFAAERLSNRSTPDTTFP